MAFQFGKMKGVQEVDGGDGLHNNMNVINTTGMYTYSKCCHMYVTTFFFLRKAKKGTRTEWS